MDTNRITGLALAISPVAAIVIWFIMGFVLLGGVGPDDPKTYTAELGANSTAVKYLFPFVTLLFLIAVGGLGYIKKSMEGGSGSYIAGFAWFLILLGAAGQLGEVAFTLALAEAAHDANWAVASSMFAGGQAIGAVTTAFSFLGFALFGFAIWQQKNFSPALAGLMFVAGIYTLIMCLVDYESPLVAIGYIGVVVSFAWMGVSLLTKKE